MTNDQYLDLAGEGISDEFYWDLTEDFDEITTALDETLNEMTAMVEELENSLITAIYFGEF